MLTALLVGCGDGDNSAPRPTPTPGPSTVGVRADVLVGTYDVALSGDLGDRDDVVGAVFASHNELVVLDARISSRTFVTLYGQLAHDGSMVITGVVGTPRRTIAVEGRGVATRDAATDRIVGTVKASSSFLDFEFSLTFDRRQGANVAPFSGVHRFAFSPSPSGCGCDSTATFEIASQTNGFARIDYAASESDAVGRELGVFAGGECLLSPTGRLSCMVAYGPTLSSAWFPAAYLFGRSAQAGGRHGTGRGLHGRRRDRETGRVDRDPHRPSSLDDRDYFALNCVVGRRFDPGRPLSKKHSFRRNS